MPAVRLPGPCTLCDAPIAFHKWCPQSNPNCAGCHMLCKFCYHLGNMFPGHRRWYKAALPQIALARPASNLNYRLYVETCDCKPCRQERRWNSEQRALEN